MSGLLSGLEKFGFSAEEMNIFDEDKKAVSKNAEGTEEKVEAEPSEEDFLLTKTVRCKMCEKTYQVRTVKSGRVKRLESDQDLRPRHAYIDTLKYSVYSCPYCGYTGMSRNIDEMTSVQRKLIQENICSKFTPQKDVAPPDTYSYDEAIERFKLALFVTIAKKGKTSDRAYICLNISWLLRGKLETMPEETPEQKELKEIVKKEEATFYEQAYEGFTKAVATESFPMCGMDETTVYYLMSVMSYHVGKLDVASKFLQSILTSPTANGRIKNKARDLKDEIIEAIKSGKVQ